MALGGQSAGPLRRGLQRSDRAIAALAAARHGVVTVEELQGIGLSPRAVRHRVAAGRIERLHRGVYCTGAPTERTRWAAAVVACGAGAVLSHRAAAALWGLRRARGAIDVTASGRTGRRRPGIAVHSGASLAATDRVVVDGIPCTSVARTLVDLAVQVDEPELAVVVERAEELRLFDGRELDAVLERLDGRAGTGAVRRVLASDRDEARTKSPAESALLAAISAAGLPRPKVNAWVALPEGGGYRPDLLWPEARLVVEVDGRTHHARRAAFEHDRRRDRRFAALRYETVRFSAREVLEQPVAVASEIGALLARAPVS